MFKKGQALQRIGGSIQADRQGDNDKLYQLEELVDDILSDEPSDDAILTMEKPDVLFDIYAQIHKLHTLLQN